MSLKASTNRRLDSEKSAYALLAAWVLLPAAVSFYDIVSALAGRFDAAPGAEIISLLQRLNVHRAVYNAAYFSLGFVTVLFALFVLAVNRRSIFDLTSVKKSPWVYLLLLLLFWCFLSTCFADDIRIAFLGKKYAFTGLRVYFFYAAVFLSALSIRQNRFRKKLLRLFCGVMTYLSALILLQGYTDSLMDVSLGFDYSGVFFQHNHFGYLLCIGTVGSAGLYLFDRSGPVIKKSVYIICMAVQLWGLLLNGTFGSYLAVPVGILALCVLYVRHTGSFHVRLLIPVLVVALITAVDLMGMIPADEPLAVRFGLLSKETVDIVSASEEAVHVGNGRGTLWMQTVERIRQRPLFGFGPEGFYGENAIISHDGHTQDSPHNEFLQMAGYTGLPSLLFYLAALVTLAAHLWKRLKRLDPMIAAGSAVVITYLASSFFGNPISNTVIYFWMFLGLIASAGDKPLIPAAEGEPSPTEKDAPYSGIVLAAAGCLLAAALMFAYSLWQDQEFMGEYADLSAMRNAEVTAALMQQNGTLGDEKEYWYDANAFSLLPVTEAPPAAYGNGSTVWGDAKEPFDQLNPNAYDYDERADYRDKIIKVHVDTSGDEWKAVPAWVLVK